MKSFTAAPLLLSAFLLSSILSSAFGLTGCVESEPLTGSTSSTVLPGAFLTVTERFLSGGTQMTARGTVKNTSNAVWSPVWIVEGQFYTDSTFTYKLGGTTKAFSFSMSKGEQTLWELKFTSSTFDLSQYPHFAVKNLRVIQQ
jgi:hypothetical protein